MNIGQTKQLFLDDAIVGSLEGAVTSVNQPTKHAANPVLPSLPPSGAEWDAGLVATFANVLFDEEEQLFKMWYGLGDIDGTDEDFVLAYASSIDGIAWERPELGLIEFRGTRANNVVLARHGCGAAVFKDPHETDPAHRYKMLFNYQIRAAHSADGLRWTPYNEGRPVMEGAHDGHNLAYWDTGIGKYVSILRDRSGMISDVRPGLITEPEGRRLWKKHWDPDNDREPENHTLRRVGQAESDDFIHWTPMRCIIAADETDPLNHDQFYNMEVLQYAGLRIGLTTVFSDDPDYSRGHVQLTCSRDGRHWARMRKGAVFIPPGAPGELDWGRIYPAQGPLLVGDEIWIYYVADATDHLLQAPPTIRLPETVNGIALARLRLDGFVSVEARERGILTTRPFTFDGDALTINADATGGEIGVEILDAEGFPQPGFSASDCATLRASEIRHVVRWTSGESLRRLAGQTVRLRFFIERAKLYSFQFKTSD